MELVVDATVDVVAGIVVIAATLVLLPVITGDVVTVSTVDDVVTIEEREYTVVDTVGPSGCLSLPIFLPPYSVNQTLTVPPVSLRARP